MPIEELSGRGPESVPGKYYVSDACLDCDLCRETAPTIFARNDAGGYSYVCKQPETPEEESLVREAVQGCCVSTIFTDGDALDWAAIPAATPFHLTAEGQAYRQRLTESAARPCYKHQPNLFARLFRRLFRS